MRSVTLGLALCALAGSAAAAAEIPFNFGLDGKQEVPANASLAVGAAQLKFDDVAKTFDLDIAVFGLALADITASHIHEAPFGSNGPVRIDLLSFGSWKSDGLGVRLTLTDVPIGAWEPALLAQNLYVNVHTTAFPGGEIRGQVIPAPSALSLVGVGLLAAARRRR